VRILVLSTMVPFVHGGAEELFVHLVKHLQATPGVEAEGFRIPFSWNPAERLIDEMLIARRLRLWNVDRVIALKFPAYLVPWQNKVLWLLHQYRQAYDMLDAGQSNIPATPRGAEILAAIRAADNATFAEATRLFVNSPVTAERLRQYNGFAGDLLRPPLNDRELFTGADSEKYILATGRINSTKRQHLLIQALRHAPGVRLVVAGPPDTFEDAERLRKVAHEQGVADRVILDLRFLPREELASLVNRSAAVAYLPFDEDSFGYCTMEAFQAGKPVLTVRDAGGVLEIVRDEDTGLVVDPTADTLGEAMRRLISDEAGTIRMGRSARAAMDAEQLNWQATIEKLLS
jgi:glycosyltransferase involved in cell wall biosynthesis